MTSHTWWVPLPSLFKNQIAPEKYEEPKMTKADFESKVTKILKLINEEEGPLRNSKMGLELITLIDDFLRQYRSLYERYNHLSGEVMKELQNLIEIREEELEATENKLRATNDQGEGVLSSEYLTALSKLQAAGKTIDDLENKAEKLVDERSMLEVEDDSLKLQLEFAEQQKTDLEGQILTLENQIASTDRELKEAEEVNDALSQQELVAQRSKFKCLKWVLERSKLVAEKGSLQQQLECVSQQVLDLNQIVILDNQIDLKEGEFMKIKDSLERMNNVLSQVELAVQKFMEDHETFQNRISEISKELRSTEKWVFVAENEKQMLQNKVSDNADLELVAKSLLELVAKSLSELEKVRQLGEGIKEKKVDSEDQREMLISKQRTET